MATTGNHHLMPAYLPPRAKRGSGTHVDYELERVKKMATILDRYMVDPIIGLVLPGAGDIIGSLLGMYTVNMAFRRKLSPVIIARMLLNLKNVALLEERHTGKASAKDWAFVVGAALLFFGTIALSVFAIVSLLRAIF
jgi:hypothetical protein